MARNAMEADLVLQDAKRFCQDDFTESLELFGCDRPAPQQFHSPISHRDDGRFNSMLGRARIDNERNSSLELIQNMLRGRRTDAAKSVCARCGQRRIECTNDFRKNRMRADSNSDRVETGVTMSGTISRRGRTIVNGPGQNCVISFSISRAIHRRSARRVRATSRSGK